MIPEHRTAGSRGRSSLYGLRHRKFHETPSDETAGTENRVQLETKTSRDPTGRDEVFPAKSQAVSRDSRLAGGVMRGQSAQWVGFADVMAGKRSGCQVLMRQSRVRLGSASRAARQVSRHVRGTETEAIGSPWLTRSAVHCGFLASTSPTAQDFPTRWRGMSVGFQLRPWSQKRWGRTN